MTWLRTLKKDYQAYLDACSEKDCVPLHFNGWLQAKIMELERRLEVVEKALRDQEAGK